MSRPDSVLPPLEALEPARLDWPHAGGAADSPRSTVFEDVYFSRQDGRAETEHVFLQGNRLAERFAAWRQVRPFVIGETGFGTGLNVLCAWACFETHAPPEARLHVVSTEMHPLHHDDLHRALAAWPALECRARRLLAQWPEPVAGVHRLILDARVVLDLHFGDSTERLAHLEGRVDAWFLDGFAPARNPAMWQPALFEAMAARSHIDATFATFTCAGVVKRGLKAAGFHWEKAPGFGRKREMLLGRLVDASTDERRRATPWFTPPASRPARHVAVIGAGLAGASVAEALARRGVRVTLLDPAGPGAGASGNPQGALYVKLAAETNAQSRFYLAGLLYTRRLLQRLDPERQLWNDCGVLQLATSDKEIRRQARFLANHPLPPSVVEGVSAAQASQRAGIELHHGGLDYPLAGWVRPAALCERLIAHRNIGFRQKAVMEIAPDETGWTLTLEAGDTLVADQVVIAAAHQARHFAPLGWLPLQPIRGQLSGVTLTENAPHGPERVLCAGGYVLPALDGRQYFGATFAPGDTDTALRAADHAANLAELESLLPVQGRGLRDAAVETFYGRASLRAASPDRTPYAGPVPLADAWQRDYKALAKNARQLPAKVPGRHHPGLWLSAAHGSRGLASAPLCAEVIASRLCDEPLPLERELVDHLHPGRRLIRAIAQGK